MLTSSISVQHSLH